MPGRPLANSGSSESASQTKGSFSFERGRRGNLFPGTFRAVRVSGRVEQPEKSPTRKPFRPCGFSRAAPAAPLSTPIGLGPSGGYTASAAAACDSKPARTAASAGKDCRACRQRLPLLPAKSQCQRLPRLPAKTAAIQHGQSITHGGWACGARHCISGDQRPSSWPIADRDRNAAATLPGLEQPESLRLGSLSQ